MLGENLDEIRYPLFINAVVVDTVGTIEILHPGAMSDITHMHQEKRRFAFSITKEV
jgi:hypothetical protein